jgi:hypothetical protein
MLLCFPATHTEIRGLDCTCNVSTSVQVTLVANAAISAFSQAVGVSLLFPFTLTTNFISIHSGTLGLEIGELVVED